MFIAQGLGRNSMIMLVKVLAPLLTVFLALASADMVGAPEDADINSPEIQNALHFAVAQYNAESDSIYTSQIVKVISVQTQVVAGVKYIFTVEMAKTSCKKTEAKDNCAMNSDPAIAQPHECTLAVWSQPWINSVQLIENTC
ncbi:cystatin-like [Tachysurus vachellii]|uniref:cystatin-like n=1 Tax=Tachysurus vachellii TaxID=175792 RepID=UPI00296AC249|nr:cystatin-like [Tachysurus vachellii]